MRTGRIGNPNLPRSARWPPLSGAFLAESSWMRRGRSSRRDGGSEPPRPVPGCRDRRYGPLVASLSVRLASSTAVRTMSGKETTSWIPSPLSTGPSIQLSPPARSAALDLRRDQVDQRRLRRPQIRERRPVKDPLERSIDEEERLQHVFVEDGDPSFDPIDQRPPVQTVIQRSAAEVAGCRAPIVRPDAQGGQVPSSSRVWSSSGCSARRSAIDRFHVPGRVASRTDFRPEDWAP